MNRHLLAAVLRMLCFAVLGCSRLGYQLPPSDPRALVHDAPNGASGGVGGGRSDGT